MVFCMNKKAQASLEYLMTYGWALILIATVIAVLIFVVMAPTDMVIFSSSDPTKIMIKGYSNIGTGVEIKLQNITGGKIEVTKITLTSPFLGGTVNGQTIHSGIDIESPIPIPAGGVIYFKDITYGGGTAGGTITIDYTDFVGLPRTVDIKPTEGASNLESVQILISDCPYTINEPGFYILANNLGPYEGTCITIAADNVLLNCDGKSITGKNKESTDIGIFSDTSQNVIVENCTITEFGDGIRLVFSSYTTLRNNTAFGNFNGIKFWKSGPHNILQENNTSNNNTYGIIIMDSPDNTLINNISGENTSGVYISASNNSILTNNNASNNKSPAGNSTGFFISNSSGCVLTGNVANNNDRGIEFFGSAFTYTALNNTVCGSDPGNDILCGGTVFGSDNKATNLQDCDSLEDTIDCPLP